MQAFLLLGNFEAAAVDLRSALKASSESHRDAVLEKLEQAEQYLARGKSAEEMPATMASCESQVDCHLPTCFSYKHYSAGMCTLVTWALGDQSHTPMLTVNLFLCRSR